MSAQKRKNLATTEDGAPYNKRARPDFAYNREPLPDVAHLGHPDLEPEDEEAHGENSNARKGTSADFTQRAGRQKNNTIFNASTRGQGVARGGVDSESGQKFSLPIDEASASDDETNAARKYLRDVRSEARGIPTVLFAPRETSKRLDNFDGAEDGEYTIHMESPRDLGGYYEDGAYVAAPTDQEYDPDEYFYDDEDEENDAASIPSLPPQETYNSRIRTLFLEQRARLQSTPPAPRISSLASSQPIWVPRRGKLEQCKSIILDSNPVPAQIASMDTRTTWRLLEVVQTILHPGMRISKRMSAWIWSLLGRLPEAGVMGMDDMNEIRLLAKIAIAMRALWDERCRSVARRMMLLQGLEFAMPGQRRQRKEDSGVTKAKEERPIEADGVDEGGEQAMDVESDSEKDQAGEEELLASAKLRLLRDLDTSHPPDLAQQANGAAKVTTQDSDIEDGEVDESDEAPQQKPAESKVDKKVEEEEEVEDGGYPDVNTRVTCDMIITIVGDIFGQKDLLACREDWDE